MQSIKEIYKTGHGPSSSHTMGPQKAAKIFNDKNPNASRFVVTLYGSLAATGKGHFTDVAIINTFNPKQCELIMKSSIFLPFHPNGMDFEAFDNDGKLLDKWRVYSVGGGTIKDENDINKIEMSVYPLSKMDDILKWCNEEGCYPWDFVSKYEDEDIWIFLLEVWENMKLSIENGLKREGVLPGTLKVMRKATSIHIKSKNNDWILGELGIIFSFALAVSEENAAGNVVVTAPTCGSCGIVPAVLKYLQDLYNFTDQRILYALATAGIIGNLIKTNASISGAEVGCQGEVGSACAMAAAGACQLLGGTPAQIEHAAEIGMEHHLGLTCDPIEGYVQIPCIERNAIGGVRAIECASFALFSDGRHRISFDTVVETMYQTGLDLASGYKETSTGGLAKEWANLLGVKI
jgi:L-serine dehydratase